VAPVVLFAHDVAGGHHGEDHQYARQHAADEQIADRQVEQKAVDDKDDTGRDDDADGSAGGRGGGSESCVKAVFCHLRLHDGADGGRGAGIGTGDSGKHAAGPDGGHAQATAHPAQDRVGEVGHPPGNAGGIDQVAGQDEQRQCQQAEEAETFEQGDPDVGQGEVDNKTAADNPESDDQEDRHAKHEQHGDPNGNQGNECSVIHDGFS